MRQRVVSFAFLFLLNNLSNCQAFVVPLQKRCNYCASSSSPRALTFPRNGFLGGSKDGYSNSNEDDDTNDSSGTGSDMDVERERNRLESLLNRSSGGNNATVATTYKPQPDFLSLPLADWKKEVRNPPPLTSIGRERMETEITLLESLAESDDAIPELWNLWYSARGPGPKEKLMKTEALVAKGQPDAWNEAEDLLRKIIAEEGIHWVEPVNRLATLMFLQSRHEESKELCELVLQLKPWHFGALSGMVMVQQGLQNQEKMLEYARQRMPPLPRKGEEQKEPPPELAGKLETRQEWVDRMLDLARAMLLRQEMDLEAAFLDLDKQNKQGKLEATVADNTATNATISKTESAPDKGDGEENEDAWQ